MELLIEEIRQLLDCRVLPHAGLPKIDEGFYLPDDLQRFYELCGGIVLFEGTAFPLRIMPPSDFVVANPVIMLGVMEEQFEAIRDHSSWSWYLLADSHSGHYATIDLHSTRLGRCYDSHWSLHPGNSTIIAFSFTDFLKMAMTTRGEDLFWELPSFQSLGDAC
jgi:hypothetical protein